MPTTFDRNGMEIVDEPGVGQLFKERLQPAGVSYCVIERVHSMRGQGVSSTFKFGRNAGLLIGMLIAHQIEFREIAPEIWQKALGIHARTRIPKGRGMLVNFPPEETKRQFKKRLRDTAQRLFPGLDVSLSTADALLMAELARRITTGYLGRPVL